MPGPVKDRIVRTEGVCGGMARIDGHRVRVLDVVEWHEHRGLTPDEIVTEIPTLTLAEVHAALAYSSTMWMKSGRRCGRNAHWPRQPVEQIPRW